MTEGERETSLPSFRCHPWYIIRHPLPSAFLHADGYPHPTKLLGSRYSDSRWTSPSLSVTPDQLASLLLSRKSIAACSAASGGGGDAAAMGAARQAPKNEATTALAIELWAAQDLTCPPPTTPSDAGTVHASARPRPARSREPSRPSLARAMAQFRGRRPRVPPIATL